MSEGVEEVEQERLAVQRVLRDCRSLGKGDRGRSWRRTLLMVIVSFCKMEGLPVILEGKDGRDGRELITGHVDGVRAVLEGSEVVMKVIDVLAKLV